MSPDQVGLLDVVPWTHGYAHSWALRWMLRHHRQARDALLGLFVHDAPAPWHVGKDDIQLEHRVGRHRADLRVEAADANGRAVTILIETKVNDEVSDSQIEAYCSEPAEVVLYGPGLTGLLHDGNDPLDRERWVTGRQVVNALAEVDVPDLLRGYLDEVGAQAARMEEARAACRGEQPDFPHEPGTSGVSGDDVEAVAWVAEVARAMRSRGAREVIARDTRHDYGIFWSGSWRKPRGSTGAGAYIDVIAAHGGWDYAITVKVMSGTVDERLAIYDAAMELDGPWDGWEPARRRRTESFRLWKLDAGEKTATEAADDAVRADDYVKAVAAAAAKRLRGRRRTTR